MYISAYLNRKLRFFSIFLCVLVVITHAYKEEVVIDAHGDTIFFFDIARFLSIGISRLAVPFFFIISGFLFFKDIVSFSINTYKSKVTKRISSLLLPYLIISAIVLLISYLIDQSNLDHIFRYGIETKEYTVSYIFKSWLYRPKAYHLWFVRNLFLLALFSPIIYYCIKGKWGVLFVTTGMILWLTFSYALPSITLSVVFFSLGGLLSLHKMNIQKCKNPLIPILISICWIFSMIIALYYQPDIPDVWTYFWDNLSISLGILFVWTTFDFIEGSVTRKISNSKLAGFAFFIYLIHEPFISYFINSSYYFFPSKTSLAIIYLLAPPLTIVFCYLVATILKKYARSFFHFISGGRQ